MPNTQAGTQDECLVILRTLYTIVKRSQTKEEAQERIRRLIQAYQASVTAHTSREDEK